MKKQKILFFYILTVIITVIIGEGSSALLDASNPDHGVIVTVAAQISPTIGLLLVCLLGRDFKTFKNMKWSFDSMKWIWAIKCMLLT